MAIGKGIVKCGQRSKSTRALCFFLFLASVPLWSLFSETVYALPESDMIELEQIFSELETTIERQRETLMQLSQTIEGQHDTLIQQQQTIERQATRLIEAEQSLTEYERAVRVRTLTTGVSGVLIGLILGAIIF